MISSTILKYCQVCKVLLSIVEHQKESSSHGASESIIQLEIEKSCMTVEATGIVNAKTNFKLLRRLRWMCFGVCDGEHGDKGNESN